MLLTCIRHSIVICSAAHCGQMGDGLRADHISSIGELALDRRLGPESVSRFVFGASQPAMVMSGLKLLVQRTNDFAETTLIGGLRCEQ